MRSRPEPGGTTRRQFLGMAAAGVATLSVKKVSARSWVPDQPVNCAVIGVGVRGREILTVLSQMQGAHIAAYCDVYEPFLRRGERIAPEAAGYSNLSELLEREAEVEAIFVATPTHLHLEGVEAALNAGKHVFCEAPLANTIDDCRAMAEAASRADTAFAVGLQNRANPVYAQTSTFLQARAVGRPVTDEGQWNEHSSWRRTVADSAYQEAMNWRLSSDVSLGLLGEFGIHTFDNSLRNQQSLPVAVSAFGSIMHWNDGRDVHDTVFSVVEYEDGFLSRFKATLANSFREKYYLMQGSDGSILMEDDKSWWFKEASAPSLGWEVYAERERIGNEEGIVLLADATQLLAQGEITAEEFLESSDDPLYIVVQDFLQSVRAGTSPACGYEEGYRANVLAIKAHESLKNGTGLEIDQGLFSL